MILAPVILFAYNRPSHTRRTLEALSENALASESELYIFVDGVRKDATARDEELRTSVLSLAQEQDWCGKVHVVDREENLGLADNIVRGVSDTLSKHGRVIVLEDDIVTAPGFLSYMNNALDMYANDEKVMHVSGFMFPVSTELPPTFFYNTGSCWGWGTWSRAWRHFNPDASELLDAIESKGLLDKFNIDGAYDFAYQLRGNIDGSLKTWAIKWYASFFLKGGHALHPYPSFTNNIGMDNSGTHTAPSNRYWWHKLNDTDGRISRIAIKESADAVSAMIEFNSGRKSVTIESKPLSFIKGLLPYALKDRIVRFVLDKYGPKKPVSKEEFPTLKKDVRYEKQSIELFGKDFQLTDSPSFLFIYKELFKDEIYRFETKNECPYIIDAGANIGLSVLYFKFNHPNARVVAFEPDPDTFEVLSQNIATYGLEDVQLINKAVWNSESKLRFFSEGADGGRLAVDGDNHQVIEVDTLRLRPYLDRPVDFLKIDIEGAECDVLVDCADLLHHVERLFVEYHSFASKPQKLDSILRVLSLAGFRYYITHVGVQSTHPFVGIRSSLGMDNQLNIYAHRIQ